MASLRELAKKVDVVQEEFEEENLEINRKTESVNLRNSEEEKA
jgi:hypothetical protein